ncbi:hypothetical protein [Sandaracinus amylolyticus]|uniref:hypothetical protein n=1 Tax=Sandaracinus amylolyticus TaxID=927083 RepID=UPI001F32BB13|nr:hypothetical protein [Sandaracinus amylolyticus]UJR83200.1 Hypothetical protein I5071_52660 [Sandaracinus amylolyticus]
MSVELMRLMIVGPADSRHLGPRVALSTPAAITSELPSGDPDAAASALRAYAGSDQFVRKPHEVPHVRELEALRAAVIGASDDASPHELLRSTVGDPDDVLRSKSWSAARQRINDSLVAAKVTALGSRGLLGELAGAMQAFALAERIGAGGVKRVCDAKRWLDAPLELPVAVAPPARDGRLAELAPQAGVRVSASYGTVAFEAAAQVAYSRASEDSARQAQKLARDVLANDDQQRLDTSAQRERPFVHDPALIVLGGSAVQAVERLEAGIELHVYAGRGLARFADPWFEQGGSAVVGNPTTDSFFVQYTDSPTSTVPSWCTWDDGGRTRGGDLRKIRDSLSIQLWFIVERGSRTIPLLVSEPFTLFSVGVFSPPPSPGSPLGVQPRQSYGAGVHGIVAHERFPDTEREFVRSPLHRAGPFFLRPPTSADRSPVVSGETANEALERQFAAAPCSVLLRRRLDEWREAADRGLSSGSSTP